METNQTQPPKPNSHMPMAIISTVLSVISCNIIPATIFGIVSIVYASKVKSKFDLGDYDGAQRASKNAKIWWIVTIATIVVLWAVSIIFFSSMFGEQFLEEFQKGWEEGMENAN